MSDTRKVCVSVVIEEAWGGHIIREREREKEREYAMIMCVMWDICRDLYK